MFSTKTAKDNFTKEDVLHQLIWASRDRVYEVERLLNELTISGNAADVRCFFDSLSNLKECLEMYTLDPESYYQQNK